MSVGSIVFGAAIVGLAVNHIRHAPMPFSHGRPVLLVAVALLFLAAYLLKAVGWDRLFHHQERPGPVSLAAAGGGASIMGIVLPGRFDEMVRIAIVRRFPGCPAGVKTICLSLVMLGLIDAAALAPFSLVAAAWPGNSVGVRIGFAVVGVGGIGAAGIVLALPHVARSARLMRYRIARWLAPRATTLRGATEAWALVSASWLVRAGALTVLLAALGHGFSFPLAMMFLCAGAAAAALPIALGGAATQVGAGATLLIVSGIGTSEALGFALAAQTLVILSGAAVLFLAVTWRTSRWLVALGAPYFVALRPRLD
ncbi:MAG: lysylphosphatidylglycerol synthase domain-containing protein [Actinomycetota bacterium]